MPSHTETSVATSEKLQTLVIKEPRAVYKLSKLTGVPLDAQDLFVPSVCEHSEERLGGEAHHVLLLERH